MNPVAFKEPKYLFSMFRSSGVEEKCKRHNKAVKRLQAPHKDWSQRQTERLNFINYELNDQNDAVRTFHDVDAAMEVYALVFGKGDMSAPLAPGPRPRPH